MIAKKILRCNKLHAYIWQTTQAARSKAGIFAIILIRAPLGTDRLSRLRHHQLIDGGDAVILLHIDAGTLGLRRGF
jgi:hypothetical protein